MPFYIFKGDVMQYFYFSDLSQQNVSKAPALEVGVKLWSLFR